MYIWYYLGLFNSFSPNTEIIKSENNNVITAMVVTKNSDWYGFLPYKTKVPVFKIPAYVFLYLPGYSEEKKYEKNEL